MNIDLSGMGRTEIEGLISRCQAELDIRKDKRRKELVGEFIKAAQKLHDEFPYVELLFEVECDEGGAHDVDFFDEAFRGKACILRYEDFSF